MLCMPYMTTLETTVNAGKAMLYNASGLFHSIGTTFSTPNGTTVTRLQAPYLPVAAVQKTMMHGDEVMRLDNILNPPGSRG